MVSGVCKEECVNCIKTQIRHFFVLFFCVFFLYFFCCFLLFFEFFNIFLCFFFYTRQTNNETLPHPFFLSIRRRIVYKDREHFPKKGGKYFVK